MVYLEPTRERGPCAVLWTSSSKKQRDNSFLEPPPRRRLCLYQGVRRQLVHGLLPGASGHHLHRLKRKMVEAEFKIQTWQTGPASPRPRSPASPPRSPSHEAAVPVPALLRRRRTPGGNHELRFPSRHREVLGRRHREVRRCCRLRRHRARPPAAGPACASSSLPSSRA